MIKIDVLEYKVGLTGIELSEIQKYLEKYSEIEEARIFGSRATGKYKPASDVDIAIFGADVNSKTAGDVKADIEENSYLPYFFDIISYNDIIVPSLKEHIDLYGILFY